LLKIYAQNTEQYIHIFVIGMCIFFFFAILNNTVYCTLLMLCTIWDNKEHELLIIKTLLFIYI
jgi:hypothetical protein